MTDSSLLLDHLRKTLQSKRNFPIGVLTYYGPDDKTISKIVAVAIPGPSADPILRRWQGPDVSNDPVTAAEIGQFFMGLKIQEIVMTEGIIGCPHEEGIDYPVGESCPNCPFWSNKV